MPGDIAAFVLPCKALKGIWDRLFFAGCLRNADPGASRNADGFSLSLDWRPRALAAGVRREDCDRKRELHSLAKERPFAAGKKLYYIRKGLGVGGFGDSRWELGWVCCANKKTAQWAVSTVLLFETDCLHGRNLGYYIGRDQQHEKTDGDCSQIQQENVKPV